MEAQALGAIPVSTDTWAVGQNVFYGALTQGVPLNDPTAAAEQVRRVVDFMRNPEKQDEIRKEMTRFARALFDWTNIGNQWLGWINEDFGKLATRVGRVAC